MIYRCPIVGTGRADDPFRPPYQGPGTSWICLGVPGTADGYGILELPERVNDPRLEPIATAPEERLTNSGRKRIGNRFGVTLRHRTLSHALGELLMDHGRDDGRGWRGIRHTPSKEYQAWMVWLSGRPIWTLEAPPMHSSKHFTESWPTNGTTVSTGQDQPWTEFGDVEVVSGALRAANATGSPEAARCDSVLDTSNQRHMASYTLADVDFCQLRACVRFQDDENYYALHLARANGTYERDIRKQTTAALTTFASDTTDPGTDTTMELVVDGSNVTGKIGGVTILGPTTDGSPELLTTFTGGLLLGPEVSTANASLDNHVIADVGSRFLLSRF